MMIVSRPTFKATAPNAVWSPGPRLHQAPPQADQEMIGVPREVPPTPTYQQPQQEESISFQPQEENLRFQEQEKPPPPPTEIDQAKTEPTEDLRAVSGPHTAADAAFTRTGRGSSHLPPSQSPTITLLQKAREGQIPKGASYIEDKHDSRGSGGDLKYEGIGPTECGIPVGLRTGVKEEYASDWYKTMYKSLHRTRDNAQGQTVHLGGYMSEPEFDRKDDLRLKYSTVDYRRKPAKKSPREVEPRMSQLPEERLEPVVYHHQPRSIADYEPGHSSLADQEFQKHEHFRHSPRHEQTSGGKWPSAFLSDGYESDSTLIRKRPTARVDPEQQKVWYKEIQKGGEIPFSGLRKAAPEKPKASPHQYQETEVNIHYRSPIRNLEKEYIEEEELRKRQEDAMRRFYEDERCKKHLQQMAEAEMRRHSDFFTPSQKSPIALNRYDNPFDSGFQMGGTPEPRTLVKALYPFTAQTTRELSLNKGDIVYINKQVDKNWYEGEHHGLVGIFPVSYVEVIPTEKANLQPKKASEGHATVHYNFRAQTPLELSLFKGENVILVRRVDLNWYEGRIGAKKGIFPASYINVIQEPGDFFHGDRAISPKPPVSPIYNGSIMIQGPTFNTGISPLPPKAEPKSPITQSLHIDTYHEPIPYRCLYAYVPQNEDELELREADTVYVMEKCDDGWYVGTSLRSGLFGTFPGNYVERI